MAEDFEFLKCLTCAYVGEDSDGRYTFAGVHADDVRANLSAETREAIKVVLFIRPLKLEGAIWIGIGGKGLRSVRRAEFDGTFDGTELTNRDRIVMHFDLPSRLVKAGRIVVQVGDSKEDLATVHEFHIVDTTVDRDDRESSPDAPEV